MVGIKSAAGGIGDAVVELLADPPEGFAILGGEDAYLSPLLAMGAHGGVVASAQVATADFARLLGAWRAGAVTEARDLGRAPGAAVAAGCSRGPTPR